MVVLLLDEEIRLAASTLNFNSITMLLIIAAQSGYHEIVKLLLQKIAIANLNINYLSTLALSCAVENGHNQVLEVLRELGVDSKKINKTWLPKNINNLDSGNM